MAPPKSDAKPGATGGETPSGASPSSNHLVSMDTTDHIPTVNLVEEVSKAAMKADGREGHIQARDWEEDTSYPPILSKGKKNIYDFTDDIPKHVKPMYHYSWYQQREYFQSMRDTRTLWQKLTQYAAFGIAFACLSATVLFTKIWLSQPKEVGALRNEMLQSAYGRVLELGAGQGINVGLYPYPVHEIVMVDQNAQQLQRLRYRLPKTTYPKYEVRHMKTEKLDEFKDHEFDCIVDMFGLCHYQDPVMALRQMQRLVKPTGVILLLEHGRSPYWIVNAFLDFFQQRHVVNTHGCRWNLPMREYFKEARLEVKEYRNLHYGTTHYVVAYPEPLTATSIVDEERRRQHAAESDLKQKEHNDKKATAKK